MHDKEKSVDMTILIFYLMAMNKPVMKTIDNIYKKCPAVYEKAFNESSYAESDFIKRISVEATFRIRRLIGVVEVDGFDAFVSIINRKHPLAKYLHEGDTDKDFFEKIKDRIPDFRSNAEAVAIYALNHLEWTNDADKIDKNVGRVLESMANQTIGYKHVMDNRDLNDIAISVADYIFPNNFTNYNYMLHTEELGGFVESAINQSGAISLDFLDIKITKKELEEAIYAGLERCQSKLDDDINRIHETGVVPFTTPAMHRALELTMVWIVIEHLCYMYSSAKQLALNEIDAKNKKAIRENTDSIKLIESLKKQVAEKQLVINEQQKTIDRLNLKYKEIQSQYNSLKKELHKIDEQPLIIHLPDIEPEAESYPDGTLVIGGHLKWRQIFQKSHPNVKCLDGLKHNINVDLIHTGIPLIVFNVSSMSHAVYYRVQSEAKKKNIPVKYIE